jgi:hypothetical protein
MAVFEEAASKDATNFRKTDYIMNKGLKVFIAKNIRIALYGI